MHKRALGLSVAGALILGGVGIVSAYSDPPAAQGQLSIGLTTATGAVSSVGKAALDETVPTAAPTRVLLPLTTATRAATAINSAKVNGGAAASTQGASTFVQVDAVASSTASQAAAQPTTTRSEATTTGQSTTSQQESASRQGAIDNNAIGNDTTAGNATGNGTTAGNSTTTGSGASPANSGAPDGTAPTAASTATPAPTTTPGTEQGGTASSEKTGDYYALFTAPIDVDAPFSVAGVTWDAGHLPDGSVVEMRTLDDGAWSDWYVLTEDSAERGRPGTEYYVSGDSTGVQVRVSKGDGALPAGMRIDVAYSADGARRTDNSPSEADVTPAANTLVAPAANEDEAKVAGSSVANGTASANGTANDSAASGSDAATNGTVSASQPKVAQQAAFIGAVSTSRSATLGTEGIHPRSAWGANEAQMTWPRQYATFQNVIVRHTAGSNTYTQAGVPGLLRGIYAYHAVTRGWGDIGYNVLIDKFGGKWEGRSGTLASPDNQMVVGAHASGFNSGAMGVSVMGTFVNGYQPSGTILSALSDVISWRFAIAGIDPIGNSNRTVPARHTSTRTTGTALPRVAGHRDVGSTECPGLIYDHLDEIRQAAHSKWLVKSAQAAGTAKPATPTQAATTVPQPSATASTSPTSTWPTIYLNDGWGGLATTTFSYGRSDDTFLVGDWDGNGTDTLALRRGSIYYLRNKNSNGTSERAIAYGKPGDEVYVGDWDGNGTDTLAVRRGNLFYVKNSLNGGEADQVIAYGKPGDTILVGNWDGRGGDTFGVRRGKFYYLRNTLSTGVADAVVPYGHDDDVVYAGKFGGGADALAARPDVLRLEFDPWR